MAHRAEKGNSILIEGMVASYDYRKDAVTITASDKDLNGFLLSVKPGTPSDTILRSVLRREGVIRSEDNSEPLVNFIETIASDVLGGAYVVYGRVGGGKTVILKTIEHLAKMRGAEVIYVPSQYTSGGLSVEEALLNIKPDVRTFVLLDDAINYTDRGNKASQARTELLALISKAVREDERQLVTFVSAQRLGASPFSESDIDAIITTGSPVHPGEDSHVRALKGDVAEYYGLTGQEILDKLQIRDHEYIFNYPGTKRIGTGYTRVPRAVQLSEFPTRMN